MKFCTAEICLEFARLAGRAWRSHRAGHLEGISRAAELGRIVRAIF